MANATNVEAEPLFVWYEGSADAGSVKMVIAETGKVNVEFSHFVMAKANMAPWQVHIDLGPDIVAKLFRIVQTSAVANLKLPALTLLPGQEMALKTLRAGQAESSVFLSLSFIEIPPTLAEVMAELRSLYETVRARRQPSVES